jgi:hypothetical protein
VPSNAAADPSFVADLHIHSRYSRACSRDLSIETLTWWARRKGIALLGTGDFTHPAWHDHLRDALVPAEAGLFRLHPDREADILRRLPPRLGRVPGVGRPARAGSCCRSRSPRSTSAATVPARSTT